MADDSRSVDGNKNNDDEDIMLDLSIGGIFGRTNKRNRNSKEPDLNDDHDYAEYKCNVRRESKRKSEGNLKELVALGSCGSVISGPFVENKEWLETQIVRSQNGDVLDIGHARKKEKINRSNMVLRPEMACRNFKPCQGRNSNGCGGCSSGRCSCHQGNPTTDYYCRSISSKSGQLADQQLPSTSTTSDPPADQPSGSSRQTVVSLTTTTNKLTNSSTLSAASSFLAAQMPCVSTTGNGPNGKRVSGFLYRYTKNEVTIVCICHGRSFSPAGFVEHAGGVDIVHPLKHITIFPTAFAS